MIKILLSFFFSFFISFFLIKYFLIFCNKYNIYGINRKININNKIIKKKNIPTMGGFIIFINFILISLIFLNWYNISILILILFFIINFIIGFLDDFLKIYFKNNKGLSILQKFFLQNLSILFFIYFLVHKNIYVSFEKIYFINFYYINYFYYITWYILLVIGINSINFTDGLDGLVIFPLLLVFLFLFIVSLFSSNLYLSKFFNIIYIHYAKDLCIIISTMLGSCLAFFSFNFFPAKIFLGDIGSLSIGSLVSAIFIILHKEFYFFIVGLLFNIEFFSVILQIFFFKFFNKRIFLMTPIHHHYELKKCSEIKIVSSFWIISLFSFFISIIYFFKVV